VAVMAEAGADISVQCSKLLSATAWRDADIAVTLCGSTRDEIRVRVEALLATVENK